MPAPTTLKSTNPTLSSVHRLSPHKTRIARRRRRANGFHSDDEIEREARSDSDTDEDDQSSVDSETDSETEPASEDVPHDGHPTLLSPGTTPPAIDGSKDDNDHAPLLAASVNWSEMVADEVANGTTDLPVVDFADLDANVIHAKTPRAPVPRRAHKSKRPVPRRHSSEPAAAPTSSGPSPEPSISSTSPEEPVSHAESKNTSPPAPHRHGRTARQAYQERLENDPSYVPTVGEFWGHDDRLLDKDLRSLSGWWRGRWQGGVRGRGFGIRGRGRGRDRGDTNAGNDNHSAGEVPPSPQCDVPPVDRQWTHDGFEELKRREEQRSRRQDQSQGSNGNSRGSRVGFAARGRAFGRARFSPRGTSRSADSPSSMTTRTWFVIKPERPWTKQHDEFLYSDPSLRPRPGQGPTYRVKLSGTRPEVIVRASAQLSPPRVPTPPRVTGNEGGELAFTVSLPRGDRKPEATSTPTPAAVAAAPPSPIPTSPPEQVTNEASLVSVPPPISPVVTASTTRPASPPVLRIVTEEQAEASSGPADDPFKLRNPPPPTVIPLATPTPTQVNSTTSTSSAAVSSPAAPPISQSASAPEGGLLWRSPPLHLQSTCTQTVPPSAPSYTSTYTYPPVSAPTLPPGVALDAHGIPYEVSTGRPMYLAAPQVHTPVYMMPYPHMQSHLQHRPHASPNPSLFAPPRQGSRIEIRRPDVPSATEDSHLTSTQTQTHNSRPSALRTSASAPAFIPSHAAATPHEFYPSPPPEVGSVPASAAVMGYAAYPQPPYYTYGGPEGYAYPQPQPQFVEYDAYNADPRGGTASAQSAYY
jgi:CASC3/Barentsz eIF4AIII binding protein